MEEEEAGEESGVVVEELGTVGVESEVAGEELQVTGEELRAVGVEPAGPAVEKNESEGRIKQVEAGGEEGDVSGVCGVYVRQMLPFKYLSRHC